MNSIKSIEGLLGQSPRFYNFNLETLTKISKFLFEALANITPESKTFWITNAVLKQNNIDCPSNVLISALKDSGFVSRCGTEGKLAYLVYPTTALKCATNTLEQLVARRAQDEAESKARSERVKASARQRKLKSGLAEYLINKFDYPFTEEKLSKWMAEFEQQSNDEERRLCELNGKTINLSTV